MWDRIVILIVVIAAICIVDLGTMSKKGLKRERIVFLVLTGITVSYGIYFYTHIFSASLVRAMFKLFRIDI